MLDAELMAELKAELNGELEAYHVHTVGATRSSMPIDGMFFVALF